MCTLLIPLGEDSSDAARVWAGLISRACVDEAIRELAVHILTAVWHMLKNDQPYRDPGGDYYERKDPHADDDVAVGPGGLRSATASAAWTSNSVDSLIPW